MRSIDSLSPIDRPIVASVAMNRVTLFGGAVLDAEAGPITGRAAQRHRLALLALLSTTKRLYRSRDQLVTLLWPDSDAEHGRKLLSDSIYRINQALGGDAITGAGEDIRLNRAQVASDVADLEAAMESREWQRVVELHAGPFLDGFYLPRATEFDQWMEGERAQYARNAAKALEMLAAEARDAGRFAEAADWWQRLAALVPDDSRVTMELMRAMEASGNRAGALRQARLHSLILRETLGMEPDRSVEELAEQMARQCEAVRIVPPASAAIARETATEHAHLEFAPRQELRQESMPAQGSSIAVLPFDNMSETDSNTYFADGVSEELMYLLTRTSGLRVASRTSVFAYRDMKLDVREVARRLHVDWILEGSVRRSGDKLRICVQLTDAVNGYQLWSESFDRTFTDILAIQAEIAVAIVNRVAPTPDGAVGSAGSLNARGASDTANYDMYLQARFQWHRRTEESISISVQLFEQLVARDPEYARAWAGLADAYACMSFYNYSAPHDAFPRTEAAARRAIQLDPTLAAPHATLAYVETYYHWNWEAAQRGFLRAIELEPNYATAHQWYGALLAARGQLEDAEWEVRRAAELDPLSLIAHAMIGLILLLSNQVDRAIQQFDGTLQLDAEFCLAHYWMGLALERKGKPREARKSLRRVMELTQDFAQACPLVQAALARTHALSGDVESARALLCELIAREAAGRYVSSYEIATVHLTLGEKPEAIARLARAYQDRVPSMAFVRVDPQLWLLADQPEFQKLVECVEQTVAQKALAS